MLAVILSFGGQFLLECCILLVWDGELTILVCKTWYLHLYCHHHLAFTWIQQIPFSATIAIILTPLLHGHSCTCPWQPCFECSALCHLVLEIFLELILAIGICNKRLLEACLKLSQPVLAILVLLQWHHMWNLLAVRYTFSIYSISLVKLITMLFLVNSFIHLLMFLNQIFRVVVLSKTMRTLCASRSSYTPKQSTTLLARCRWLSIPCVATKSNTTSSSQICMLLDTVSIINVFRTSLNLSGLYGVCCLLLFDFGGHHH